MTVHPTSKPVLDRRQFLLSAGAASAAAVGIGATPAPTHAESRSGGVGRAQPTRARNVIFMVSDGMSTGTLTLAHIASKRWRQKPSTWVDLWNQAGVRRAFATTHSADSLVTDSAAGGSAWGAGVHINNGAINVNPDGAQLMPILPHAAQSGKATGVVTTTRVTHATPASFVANASSRDHEDRIAFHMLARKLDVIMGGGAKFFPAELTKDYPQYTIVRNAPQLAAARDSAGPLLGLFSHDHVPMEVDRLPIIPSLAEMSRVALDRLDRNKDGFVLQIEGGRIDHAAHINDAASIVADQLAFDDAIGVVREFTRGRDDTLVVLTTDHGNANPGLTLYGDRANTAFDRLAQVRRSFERIEARLKVFGDPAEAMKEAPALIEEAVNVRLSAAELAILAQSLANERVAPFGELNSPMLVLGALLANHFGVSFISGNHTADLVEVTAWGPGSQAMPQMIDNIDLHGLMVTALALPPAKRLEGMEEILKVTRRDGD